MCSHCPSSTTCGSQGGSGVSGKQAPKNLTLWRRIVQFIFLFIMGKWVYYGIFRCPYIVPFVNCESCSMITCWGRITTYFYAWWIILPIMVVFFGRA
ncbi:MAG: 4Fe-4S binding protein, partial [Veillonella sp.]|nr:4Fe-4S binding protein [Veillonella sp.]